MIIDITLNECSKFNGGWGLSPHQVYLMIKHVDFDGQLNILEFGSGDGTTHLVNLLNEKNIKFDYTSIEHDATYAKTPNVAYQLYHLDGNYIPNDLETVSLVLDKTYDLVIVDGPHGSGRAKWYSKFKNNIRIGTVILIDDFHHFPEFSDELDKNFTYETINLFNLNTGFTEEPTNSGLEKVDVTSSLLMDKSYKIIKIKSL